MAGIFDQNTYLQNKTNQLNTVGQHNQYAPGSPWTVQQTQQAISDAGMNPYSHYMQYGQREGVTGSPYAGEQSTAQDAMGTGLGMANYAAQSLAGMQSPYPGMAQHQGPVTMSYSPMVTPNAYQGIDYQTLTGGDYNALQNALYQQGATAVDEQYKRGQADIANSMGGRGLYGSTMMGSQMQDLTEQSANTKAQLAAQAAAKRYEMQMQEQALLNRMAQDSAQFGWKAGYSNADLINQYNQNKLNWDYQQANLPVQFANQEADRAFGYNLDRENYARGLLSDMFNRGINLAGGSSGSVNSAAQIAAQNEQAARNRESQMWSGIGSGLLSGFTPTASGKTTFGNIWDTAKGAGDWLGNLF